MLAGDTARVPLVAFTPVQLPEAVHKIALVEDQVTIETLPEGMLVGLAENVTLGAGNPPRPGIAKGPWLTTWAVTVVLATASTAGEASTKAESAIIDESALASRALGSEERKMPLSEETKMERTCITPNPIQAVGNAKL